MNSELISALIGGAAGVVISTIAQLVMAYMTNKSEEKRALRELAVNLGMKEYENARDHTIRNGGGAVYPPEMWVCASYVLLRRMHKLGKVSAKDLLRESVESVEEMGKYSEELYQTKIARRR